ncbi:MAG: hypothetical protein HY330_00880 [Chloroflexi bacterium]|nr:hypothetical protein [Chloroflexota bacterium]
MEVRSFTIQTADRSRFTFTARGDVGFTASHLREHMLVAERVKVTYVKEREGLRALRVEDAP